MDWNWDKFGDDDDDDENDEGGDYKPQWGSRDGLIFLIDCSQSMFTGDAGNDDISPFELCIKCAKSVIQNKIISSDRDLLGIVFFGTDKSKNSSDFKHIYVLHDLGIPGADKVLELEAFLDEPANNDFKKNYGHSEDFSLSDALWTCSNMFSNCTQKLGYKRVLLFTNNDQPHNNAQLRRQAAAKAEDLHQNGIEIELMHINPPDHDFDVTLFYKDILFMDEDENIILPDASTKFDELLTRVRSKDHKKRAMGHIPFSLGDGLEFSVGIYNLVRSCTKPSAVKLYKKTNEEVKTVTKTFLAETGEILMPQDIMKCQTYAGKKICFEQEELAQMKSFAKSGLMLMGFKPRSCIKRYFHVRPAQFIYPDETMIQGSTTMFTAMLKRCLERDVVAICRYILRNSPPKFIALLPQAEELDEHKVQVVPPGFHVIFLPFADDFRKVNFDETLPRANTDQIQKAKDIIKKLMFKKFSCDNFENPSLQTHYANVEAMALDRDEPDEITDYTLPNIEIMDKKCGKMIEDFKELVFPVDYVPGAKRKASGAGAAGKKPKIEAIEIDVEAEARAGRIAKLTVAVLKEYIKKQNISTSSSRKADLIDAIAEHLGL